MNKLIALVFSLFILGCKEHKETLSATQIKSPDGQIEVRFHTDKKGTPFYTTRYKNQTVVDTSYLGLQLRDIKGLENGFKVTNSGTAAYDSSWKMPWGEQQTVPNKYNELWVRLQETSEEARILELRFKVYDDGIGFRYEVPKIEGIDTVYITEEHTQFNLTQDFHTFWIPGDWDIYEHLYSTTKLSEIDATTYRNHPSLAQTAIPNNAVNTPVTMVGSENLHISIHEAALVDYSGMTLGVDTLNLDFNSILVGSDNRDYKVKKKLPFHTPWRTIQITDNAPDLIESNLIVNLNEPNKIGDVSWFTPMKYTGVWWEMHLGKSTWDYGMTQNMDSWEDTGKAHGKHGATTENVKKFIEFSSQNNIGGVLVEGWNTGWEHWIGFEDREGVFDFVTPYPDYDLEEVVAFAKARNVQIIMHHETSAATETYAKQQDTAFALMQKHGIHSVKTGYVGKILPKGEYHHGQYMVNHYNKTVEKAANYQVAINAHEPIKPTGLRRTYPNTISREGLRGQEFNAWSSDGGNPPEHLSIVAFTRMLAGPIDYTPGIFNIKFDKYKKDNQVNTTLAHQLALYVVIYSPIQMAADLVEHYEANPEPLQFIKDVGVDWQQTQVLDGAVGDFVIIAREERETGNWFVGGITDENQRSTTVNFDFLEKGKTYELRLYKDGADAHWDDNPLSIDISSKIIKKGDSISLDMKPGGGFAMSLRIVR